MYALTTYAYCMSVIYMHLTFSNFWISMGWMRQREGFRGTRVRIHHLQKKKDGKTWLVRVRGCGCFTGCSPVSWNEERSKAKTALGGGVGILKPECIYRLPRPNDLLPLLHQHLLPVAWKRVRFYFASVTALDAIFRTGKGFCFQFQADGVGGRRRKGQEEKGSHEMNSKIMCRVLYASVFSKCVHGLWYSHESAL